MFSSEQDNSQAASQKELAASEANTTLPFGGISEELLNREIFIAMSPHGMKTKPGTWKNTAMPFRTLLGGLRHEIGEKDGKCILQGEVIDGERKATAIRQTSLLMLDLDTGEQIDAIRDRIKERGWAAAIWTTFNHLKPVTEVRKDQVIRHMGREEEPTLDDVCGYLREVRRVQAWVLEGAELLEPAHTKEGVMVRVRHKPMPKYRLLFILKTPFIFATRAVNPKKAIEQWKSLYAGVSELLGAAYDRSCVDPSRLMFTPRHAKGAQGHFVEFISGEALDIDSVPMVDPKKMKVMEGGDAFDQADARLNGGSGEIKTKWLKRWLAINADSFEAEEFWREYGEERRPRTNDVGHHFKCPNDGNHSNPDDPEDNAFFVVSGPDNKDGKGFTAVCMHDSCRETLDRGQMLELVIQEHNLKESDLEPFISKPVQDDDAAADAVNGADGEGDAFTVNFDLPGALEVQHGRIGSMVPRGKGYAFQPICAVFRLVARISDHKGDRAGIIIEFRDANGVMKRQTLPVSKLFSASGCGEIVEGLANAGFQAIPSKKGQLADLLAQLPALADQHIIEVTQPGWYLDGAPVWVSPLGEAIGEGGAVRDDWRLAKGCGVENRQKAGTIEAWRETVASLAADNPMWAYGLASGFVGPMLDLLGHPSCGDLAAGDTSSGKTSRQIIAASVVSNPVAGQGVLHELNSTENAVEALCLAASGGPIGLDELGNVKDAKSLSQLVYRVAGGQRKARLKTDGTLREGARWSVYFTMSSELGLKQLIEAAGGRYLGGLDVRAVNLVAPTVTVSNVEPRVDRLKANYGHALPLFVRGLHVERYVEDRAKLQAEVDDALASLLAIAEADGMNITGAVRRSGRVFAMVGVAGVLAEDFQIITPETGDHIRSAVRTLWRSYLTNATVGQGDQGERALASLRNALNSRRGLDVLPFDTKADDALAEMTGTGEARQPERRFREPVAFYGAHKGEEVVFVRREHLAAMAGNIVSVDSLVQKLRNAGALIDGHDRPFWRKVPKQGQIEAYKLKAEAIGFLIDADDDTDDADD